MAIQSRTNKTKCLGGLKMIQLNNYILALKCMWIRRLIITNANYKNIFQIYYTQISELITRGVEYMRRMKTNKNNQFWNDVLDSWIKLCNLNNPNTLEDISSVNIWDSKDIKVANTTIFYKKYILYQRFT